MRNDETAIGCLINDGCAHGSVALVIGHDQFSGESTIAFNRPPNGLGCRFLPAALVVDDQRG